MSRKKTANFLATLFIVLFLILTGISVSLIFLAQYYIVLIPFSFGCYFWGSAITLLAIKGDLKD